LEGQISLLRERGGTQLVGKERGERVALNPVAFAFLTMTAHGPIY